jgi:predicted dehydrogenase
MLESNDAKYLGIVIEYPQDSIDAARIFELRSIQATPGIGAGFIGAGNFAKSILIPTLKKMDVELVGVCTATGISATETAKKHGFGVATTDVEKLLNDSRINTIFIATRHDTHAKLAAAALAAGKHVFVEKPLCIKAKHISDYEQTLQSPAAAGRCLMVGFNRRFSPHTKAIRDVFTDRTTPMFITYRVNAGAVPRDSWVNDEEIGGGRIVGEVCHFVDWCEAVIGAAPVNVTAECIGGTDDVRVTPEDSVAINIRYDDGSVANIQYVSLGSPALPKERAEVYADGVVAVVDDFVTTSFHGIKRAPLRTRQDKGFSGELTAFLDSIRRGGEPPISFASLERTTRLTFAILESLRSGKTIATEPDGAAEPAATV